MDDFADVVADIVDASRSMDAGGGGKLADLFSKQKVRQGGLYSGTPYVIRLDSYS